MTSLETQSFLVIHTAGSISRAAEKIYISQSSLSSQLHMPEQELGCPLFVRSRGSQTNPPVRHFPDCLRDVLADQHFPSLRL